ncbi:MAG: DUF1176 domain-containing protein [Cyanobacteria bacterium P01_H01_bin.58]
MKAPHAIQLALAVMCVAACSQADIASSQALSVDTFGAEVKENLKRAEQFESLTKTKTDPNSSQNDYAEQLLEQARQDAYEWGLKNLKLVVDRYPDAEPVIQSMTNHPEQTYEMFEGCMNYWRDHVSDLSSERQTAALTHGYLEFRRMPESTRIYIIGNKKHLVTMPCAFGTYWEAVANFIYDETGDIPHVKPLALPIYDAETRQVTQSSSNINIGLQSFNEETQTLGLGHKYSGMGNCGKSATYILENDALTLVEFREQRTCDSDGSRLPGDFPIIYP